MSIVEIMQKNDEKTVPIMEIGSIVIPANSTVKLISPKVKNLDTIAYGHAIVISMTPFILVSERGDMRWQNTVKEEDFISIGKARQTALELCNSRKSS